MAWQNLGLIFVAGLDLGMALLIWLKNSKNKINISFSLAILLLAIWTLAVGMFKEATTLPTARIWTWIQNFSGGLMVIPFFLFSIYFPYQNFVLKNWHRLLISLSILPLIYIVFVPGAWIKEIYFFPHSNDYLINRFGLLYFAIFFYFYVIFAFVNLIRKYLSSSGFIQEQLKYLIISSSIISFFGSIFGVIIPLILAHVGPHWLGPYFSLFMILFLVYFGFYYKGR